MEDMNEKQAAQNRSRATQASTPERRIIIDRAVIEPGAYGRDSVVEISISGLPQESAGKNLPAECRRALNAIQLAAIAREIRVLEPKIIIFKAEFIEIEHPFAGNIIISTESATKAEIAAIGNLLRPEIFDMVTAISWHIEGNKPGRQDFALLTSLPDFLLTDRSLIPLYQATLAEVLVDRVCAATSRFIESYQES